MGMNIAERMRLLVSEAFARRKLVTALFLVTTLAVTAAGLLWPKSFTSYSTVHVAGNALVSGLVDGSDTDESDWGSIAKEILFGKTVLSKVADTGGWDLNAMPPDKADYLLQKLRDSTEVSLVGDSLIRIEYRDSEPARAQRVAQAYADTFIAEMVQSKASSSQQTLKFIDAQAKKYEAKLQRLEKAVEQFREQHQLAGPDAQTRSAERLARLQDEYQQMQRSLEEAQVRKDSVEKQLHAGTGSANLMSSVEEAYRAQLSELRKQLADLRVRYHDSFPDVRTTKSRIAQVEERLRALKEGSGDAQELASEAVQASPVFEELRSQAREAGVQLQTLRTQLAATKKELEAAQKEQEQVRKNSNRLAQLTRDYEVTRELHQNLLRRREAARVSANLERAGAASGLRVEEPAFLPHKAEGPRLLFFLAGAVAMGLLLPVGGIFAIQQLDPRIRRSDQLSQFSDFPVLAAVPCYRKPAQERAQIRGALSSVLLMLVGIAIVAAAGVLRLQGDI
jgi:polysaccharide chain length determinant protein (PEP-CTERM system associated)